jgi:putative restriction endonuclease
MKEGQKLWTRDELILAINLYCKLPFGKMHGRNSRVKDLAKLIGRSPGAVSRKLTNLASFDPFLKARGIKGSTRAGKLDEIIWNEFYNNWDAAFEESEKLLIKFSHTTVAKLYKIDLSNIPKGLDKYRWVKTRVNHYLFQEVVMSNYNNRCCITGIDNPELLIASHIAKWSKDENNRLNPMNGLCLNALHDKAFENGLITISAEDFTIKVSSLLKKKQNIESIKQNFLNIEGKAIKQPDKFLPSKELLVIHNNYFKP